MSDSMQFDPLSASQPGWEHYAEADTPRLPFARHSRRIIVEIPVAGNENVKQRT